MKNKLEYAFPQIRVILFANDILTDSDASSKSGDELEWDWAK